MLRKISHAMPHPAVISILLSNYCILLRQCRHVYIKGDSFSTKYQFLYRLNFSPSLRKTILPTMSSTLSWNWVALTGTFRKLYWYPWFIGARYCAAIENRFPSDVCLIIGGYWWFPSNNCYQKHIVSFSQLVPDA